MLFFGVSDSRRFHMCLCVICIVQKVERRLDNLSDGSQTWPEGEFLSLLQRCASIYSSHRRTSTGYHVACLSNLNKSDDKHEHENLLMLVEYDIGVKSTLCVFAV